MEYNFDKQIFLTRENDLGEHVDSEGPFPFDDDNSRVALTHDPLDGETPFETLHLVTLENLGFGHRVLKEEVVDGNGA